MREDQLEFAGHSHCRWSRRENEITTLVPRLRTPDCDIALAVEMRSTP